MLARHARLRHTGARLLVLALVTILVTPLLALGGSSQDAAAASELPVYTDALESGWSNWSWSTATNFANSGPVYSGSAAAAVTYTAAWGGFYLHSGSLIAGSNYATFRFSIHGGNQGGQRLLVKLADANGNFGAGVAVTAPAGAWTQVSVPLASLGNIQQVSGIIWQDATGGTQPTFYLDSISFVSTGEPSTQTTPSAAGPALSVNAGANRHAISPDIYGMNYLDEALAAELRLPVRRWGGNAATRYNWQNDTANRASDWYFLNMPENNSNPGALPDGSTADGFVEQNQRTGTRSLLTVPLIGYTPKARTVACGFSVAKYGAQQQTDPYHPDCGNGLRADGSKITGNDPADTSNPIAPGFVQSWVSHLVSRYGPASQGGVRFYNLDNEPMLWDSTHRDVHPNPTSYDEIRDRTYSYGSAIKAADPTAQTLGPVTWGWTAYFYSALDVAAGGSYWQNPPDRNAHGGVPFTAWYLQQMRAYEQQHGRRILDYLDLHYYPQAAGVTLSPAGDAATQARRLRSTRSLWDPAYVDESWINEPVRLLPRMRDWVAQNYPGTKLAVTEYNWGALDHINGALAQADVLGIFGREGLDLATLWEPPAATDPGAYAFRVYRNYDGNGSAFGDLSVQASSADQDRLAVYAALRNSDGAMTLVVVNKTGGSITSNLALSGFGAASSAKVFRYSAENLGAIVRTGDQAVSTSGFTATYPGSSITLLVLPPSGAPVPTRTPSPFQSGPSVHVGNMEGIGARASAKQWKATVTVQVHDSNHIPVSGAAISGVWSNLSTGSATCTTDAAGQCSIAQTGLVRSRVSSVTFSVSSITHASLTYDPAANHDLDGDSNGTSIAIAGP